jgi:hypothetical protein
MVIYSTCFIFSVISKTIKYHALEEVLDSTEAKEGNIHII